MDKNCLPWSKQYFETELTNLEVSTDDFKATITDVSKVNGDCDVTQRKGKVLCIYDMSLSFAISGSKDGNNFNGTVSLFEFIHDQDDDEYVFTIESNNVADIKQHFLPVLKAKLVKFQPDLISAHEKGIQDTAL